MTDMELVLLPTKKHYIKLELVKNPIIIPESGLWDYVVEKTLQGSLIDIGITVSAESDVRRTAALSMHVDDEITLINDYFGNWLDRMVWVSYGIYDASTTSIKWFLQGSFLFTASSYLYDAANKTLNLQVGDIMTQLTEQRGSQIGFLSGYEMGAIIKNALEATIARFAMYKKTNICDFEDTVPYDIDVTVGSYPYALMNELINLWPWYEHFYSKDGTYTVKSIPTTMEEDVVLTMDDMDAIVISENGELDYSQVKNSTEIWGKEIKANYTSIACNTIGRDWQIAIPTLTKYERGAKYLFVPDTNSQEGQNLRIASIATAMNDKYSSDLASYNTKKEQYDNVYSSLLSAQASLDSDIINENSQYMINEQGDKVADTMVDSETIVGCSNLKEANTGDHIVCTLKVRKGQICFCSYDSIGQLIENSIVRNQSEEDKVILVDHYFTSKEKKFRVSAIQSESVNSITYELAALGALVEPIAPVSIETTYPIVVENSNGTFRPIGDNEMVSGTAYVVKYKDQRFILQGESLIHVMCMEYTSAPDSSIIAGLKTFYNCNDIMFVIDPESKFACDKIGIVNQVLSDGDYANIYTTQLGYDRASYENWKSTRLQDSITLETLFVPWLDVNQKVEYRSIATGEVHQYIVREIQANPVAGTMSIKMIRFYPLYPWFGGENDDNYGRFNDTTVLNHMNLAPEEVN